MGELVVRTAARRPLDQGGTAGLEAGALHEARSRRAPARGAVCQTVCHTMRPHTVRCYPYRAVVPDEIRDEHGLRRIKSPLLYQLSYPVGLCRI